MKLHGIMSNLIWPDMQATEKQLQLKVLQVKGFRSIYIHLLMNEQRKCM